MKIILSVIGKTTEAYLREGISKYAARIPHYVPFEIREFPDVRIKSQSAIRQKQAEGSLLLGSLKPGDVLILLDEHGRELTSRELSSYIDKRMNTVSGNLVLAIGGPYGFSEEVYKRAEDKLSLSRMTFPHELVRLFITEQIYRAMTILRGEPYHHD